MEDPVKITGLPFENNPATTDVVPIVHSGVTEQTPISNILSLLNFAGSFVTIDRETLSVAGDVLSVDNLPAFKYLRVTIHLLNTSNINAVLTLNGDAGGNYSGRSSTNGGADSTGTSATGLSLISSTGAFDYFIILDILNVATQEKLIKIRSSNAGTAGAANLPERLEGLGKWVNVADEISTITVTNSLAGSYAADSDLVVEGLN